MWTKLLIVDSKALRFTPDSKLMAEYMKKFPQVAKAKINQELSGKTKATTGSNVKASMLWIKKGNEIEPVKVVTGLSDGTKMEIKSGVSDGDEVIFAIQSTTNSDTAKKETVSSPFMPKRPGGGPKK